MAAGSTAIVGIYDRIVEFFNREIESAECNPEHAKALGLLDYNPGLILLYGPRGCGKTLIVNALANKIQMGLAHIRGISFSLDYNTDRLGEPERAVRELFDRARANAPCILFLDELEAWTAKNGGIVAEKMFSQLFYELDKPRPHVYVIGATNRPDLIERRHLRPGKIGKRFYVRLPNSTEERLSILKVLARKKHIDADVDLTAIAIASEKFSGADLDALMNAAAEATLDEKLTSITTRHFEIAQSRIRPSVSDEEAMWWMSHDELKFEFPNEFP